MAKDPENRLLWQMPLRRLESEIIRDRVLAVSGTLIRSQGGPPVPLSPNPDGSVTLAGKNLPPTSSHYRRSVYLLARRNYHLTELNVFDQPLVTPNCLRRTRSAVVLQSLTMLNGAFIREHAEHFAVRVRRLAGANEDRRIETAFRLAFVRPPGPEEIEFSRELLHKQAARQRRHGQLTPQQAADAALADLCHMLFNTNEWLYVE